MEIALSEPGYYEDGSFGIRLENVLIIKEAATKFNFGDKGYLSFEHITWVSFFLFSKLTQFKETEMKNNGSKSKGLLGNSLFSIFIFKILCQTVSKKISENNGISLHNFL